MATFTASANSNATIGWTHYGNAAWVVGTTNGACQGAYKDTVASDSRVGLLFFSGAGAALNKKIIQSISLTITCQNSGSGGSNKVLTFRKSKVQTFDRSKAGSAVAGDVLGTLTGRFYGNTVTYTLNASSNASLFNAMKAYFAAGNSVLILYNGETSSSSGYSANYARVTTCTLSVTYTEATIWYNLGGTWKQCSVWYNLNGTWKQCVPYYYTGGKWVRV